MVQIIAHRGNSWVAPQNTMAAFESAARCGAHGIEVDVQRTADGRAAVIHDPTIDTTTDGSGRVAEFSANELGTFDAGVKFSPAYAEQHVPMIEEIFDLMQQWKQLDLLLEFKGKWNAADVTPVLQGIRDQNLVNRVVVQSFSIETLRALKAAGPDIRRDLLITTFSFKVIQACEDLGVRGCNPSAMALISRPALVQELHEAGYETSVWTLNRPDHYARAVDLEVDRIITDRPDFALGWLAGRQ